MSAKVIKFPSKKIAKTEEQEQFDRCMARIERISELAKELIAINSQEKKPEIHNEKKDFDFQSIMKVNQEKIEKLKQDRKKANFSVKKSHNLGS